MPVVGFYAVVPALFVVFHVYALLQLVVLARRIGLLKLALRRRRGPAAFRQRVLVSPFAISQRLFGEPRGLAPQLLLRLSIWLTLVLIPLSLLLATQVRFLPYHATGVTWAHRLYIALDALLVLLLWPAIIHPGERGALERLSTLAGRFAARRRSLLARARAGAETLRRRALRRRRAGGRHAASSLPTLGALTRGALALLVLFAAFVVATVPGESIESALLTESEDGNRTGCASLWRIDTWLGTVSMPDGREVLCVTYGLFEAPETPLGLRRSIVAPDASLVVVEPSQELIDELGARDAWRIKGKGIDLQGRDLRFADLSDSDLRRADLRGANLQGAVLQRAKLTAALAGAISRAEVGDCLHKEDSDGELCLTGLTDADLTTADLRFLEGFKIDLQGANLTGARLDDARLEHGRLDGALLTWARLDRAWLDSAQLTGAVLREVMAQEVRLDYADLAYAFLRQADLRNASMVDVLVESADFGGIEIPEAPRSPGASTAEDEWDAQIELTARLFLRACPEVSEGEGPATALAAHGVVQRLWHEFDYSKSHDRDGYALVADLRLLLVQLMLDRRLCPGAREMSELDVCRLHRFVSEWHAWREVPVEPVEKPIARDPEDSWSRLRDRIGLADLAADGGPVLARPLNAAPADQRSCPEP
jgi:uncharacterized protein YjbI with pentapeptide repeats